MDVLQFQLLVIVSITAIAINNAEHLTYSQRQTCGCNSLEQLQPWSGELCICIPKSSTFSMSCSCPHVQQQLQQSKRCGCSLHERIGQHCQTGCQHSCNMQCNPYMPQIYCDKACFEACMQSCNLEQQQQQHQQTGNLPYWNPYINSLQQSYHSPFQQQLQPITEQCIICISGCEQICSIQQSFFDGNRLQCGCMQQCQQSCSPSMQSQQCIPNCQQNCQQFCSQQANYNQQCQPQCKQQCINICIISLPHLQFIPQMNSMNYPNLYSHPSFPSYSHPSFPSYLDGQSQNCFFNCFDSCKQSCDQQFDSCSNPCSQNCQQFCHRYQQQQQQQPIPVLQQPMQPYKPQIIRIDLHDGILESAQCIPHCQQKCLQQCSVNLRKGQCHPACQTICQQNCDQHQMLSTSLSRQQQQQQQQLSQCQQTSMLHCYCTNGNIPCNDGTQCCKKY